VTTIRTDPLTGDLVTLRELREADLPRLVEWWQATQTAVRQLDGPAHPRPGQFVAENFRTWSQNSGADVGLSVVERASGEFAGHVTLYGASVKDRCATLAIIVGPPFQGRGVGRDALKLMLRYGFDELGLHRVELNVLGYNEPAIRAYRAVGFREEGRRRSAVFRSGGWHDEVLMGLLSEEWYAAHNDAR
jgi:RimJ/RimL family protein N-acetyltransferase